MEKSAEAFRTISEVAHDLDLPQHVLRFWETRFVQIKPLKRGGGRRYYRPEDVELLRAIRQLLYGEGYTIKGVQKILKEQGGRAVAAAYGAAGSTFVPPEAGFATEGFDEGDEAGGADFAEPLDEATEEAGQPRSPIAAVSGAGLSGEQRSLLQEVLTELADCARILDMTRSG